MSDSSRPTIINYYPLPADILAGPVAQKILCRAVKRNGYQFVNGNQLAVMHKKTGQRIELVGYELLTTGYSESASAILRALDKVAKQELRTRAFPARVGGSFEVVDDSSPLFKRHFNTDTGEFKAKRRESFSAMDVTQDPSKLAELIFFIGAFFKSLLRSAIN